MQTVMVYTTISRESANEFAKKLVEDGLVACVNIVDINSVYRWKGKIYIDDEALLIMKTVKNNLEKLFDYIKKNHPYELPEIIVVDPRDVYEEYDKWVVESCR